MRTSSRRAVPAVAGMCAVGALLAGCSDWSEYNDVHDNGAVRSCIAEVRLELGVGEAQAVEDFRASNLGLSETWSTPTRTRFHVTGNTVVGDIEWSWGCSATVTKDQDAFAEVRITSLDRLE